MQDTALPPNDEAIPHTEANVQAIAEVLAAQEQLRDPVTRRDYFGHLDGDDVVDLVQRYASLVRTGDSNQHQPFDGDKVYLPTHEVPDQRDREQLVREGWDTARSFLDDPEIPDQNALDYAALTMAGVLLDAHPWDDANGRVARLFSFVMSQGSADEAKLEPIISAHVDGAAWYVIPARLTYRNEYDGNQPANITWKDSQDDKTDGIDPLVLDSRGTPIVWGQHREDVLRTFIEQNGADNSVAEALHASSHLNQDGTTTLDSHQFVEQLVTNPHGGIEYARQLVAIRRGIQTDFTRRWLEAMRSKDPIPLADSQFLCAKNLIAAAAATRESIARARPLLRTFLRHTLRRDGTLEKIDALQQMVREYAAAGDLDTPDQIRMTFANQQLVNHKFRSRYSPIEYHYIAEDGRKSTIPAES